MADRDLRRCILREGQLVKRSVYIKAWNKRLVVLMPTRLLWCRPSTSTTTSASYVESGTLTRAAASDLAHTSHVLNSIPLCDVLDVRPYHSLRQPNAFKITTRSDVTVILAAPSDDAAVEWVSAIRLAVRTLRASRFEEAVVVDGATRELTAGFQALRDRAHFQQRDAAHTTAEHLAALFTAGSERDGAVEWVPDAAVSSCTGCGTAFVSKTGVLGVLGAIGGGRRRHHCRLCGGVFCRPCVATRIQLSPSGVQDFLGDDMFGALVVAGTPGGDPSLEVRACTACIQFVTAEKDTAAHRRRAHLAVSSHPGHQLVADIADARDAFDALLADTDAVMHPRLELHTPRAGEPARAAASPSVADLKALLARLMPLMTSFARDFPSRLEALDDMPLHDKVELYLVRIRNRRVPRARTVVRWLSAHIEALSTVDMATPVGTSPSSASGACSGASAAAQLDAETTYIAEQNVDVLTNALVILYRLALENMEYNMQEPAYAFAELAPAFHATLDIIRAELSVNLPAAKAGEGAASPTVDGFEDDDEASHFDIVDQLVRDWAPPLLSRPLTPTACLAKSLHIVNVTIAKQVRERTLEGQANATKRQLKELISILTAFHGTHH